MNNDPDERAWHPQIVATDNGGVCLIYEKGLRFDPSTKTWSGDSAMYARVSTNSGETWGPARRISSINAPNGRATHAKSFVCGRRIHLVWGDVPEGATLPKHAGYYVTSPDGGVTWSEPERVCAQWDDAAPCAVVGTDTRAVVLLAHGAIYATVRTKLPEPPAAKPAA